MNARVVVFMPREPLIFGAYSGRLQPPARTRRYDVPVVYFDVVEWPESRNRALRGARPNADEQRQPVQRDLLRRVSA